MRRRPSEAARGTGDFAISFTTSWKGCEGLTLEMIRRLHRQLGIPADVLIAS